MKTALIVASIVCFLPCGARSQVGGERCRLRDTGIEIGILPAGPFDAITDVPGVLVGHKSLIEGDRVRTGVTAIVPHRGNIFREKVPAAVYVGNGFGKLMGFTQIEELGNIETPIVLTNTLSVPTAAEALVDYILSLPGNETVQSVNPIVGETNDGWLNDIRGLHIKKDHVLSAIRSAAGGMVEEGCVGAGTGTVCFGWKGGIGTASRRLPTHLGGWTVGVLVQSNFGGVLQIAGVPVGKELGRYYLSRELSRGHDGSCMIVLATDAPLSARNLRRLAKRTMLGLARTGGISSNGSGDYAIAFSTSPAVRVLHEPPEKILELQDVANDCMTPLFLAAEEATEEAILNSLFAAKTVRGKDGHIVEALPIDTVLSVMERYGHRTNPCRGS